jgi:cytochrome c-type biogenesis protein CcmH/NrfG
MEIAIEDNDRYAEEFHRGVGLLWLVRRWDADFQRQDPLEAERTLTKAARSLRRAIAEKPNDPRANLYLGDVYERLGQQSAARAAWRCAKSGLPDQRLTPNEHNRLIESLASI